MSTNSTQETVFGAMFSPLLGEPRMGLVPLPKITVTTATLTTGGGARTLTIAEMLGSLIIFNVDDAQNIVLPTAALLVAGIPGCADGASFQFDIRNSGDATGTVVGTATGCTLTGTATIATTAGKRFRVVVTTAAQGSEAYTCYSLGAYTF